LGGRTVQVREGIARLPDGTLAGSSASLLDNLRRAVDFGIPLAAAVRAATANPARIIGLEGQIGSLQAGSQADILILDSQLNVVRVMLRGKWLDLDRYPGGRP
jgi:N-acetylglucosamine-6-phosphate deacetylase